MSKKIISVLLSVTLVLSLFTVFISADELSPVMKKSLSQLQGELSGFYKTAKSQVAGMTGKIFPALLSYRKPRCWMIRHSRPEHWQRTET